MTLNNPQAGSSPVPNFFIAGAAKAGTTSLWMYLKQHPDIFMPEDIVIKEPAYFCKVNGTHQYHGDYARYLSYFKDASGQKAVGEASTTYLTYPESAAWIRKEIPDAKIIIMLRNPVDRSYSLYRWMVNHGHEWLNSYEKALEAEQGRKDDPSFFTTNPHTFYDYLYFGSGLYCEQLARYYEAFPADQVKVILLDELKHKPVETVQEIYSFLGVDAAFVPTIKVHNKAEYRPVSIGLHFLLSEVQRKHRLTRRARLARMMFDKNLRLLKLKWPKLTPAMRRSLTERYREDILKTQALIGKDLSGWLEKV